MAEDGKMVTVDAIVAPGEKQTYTDRINDWFGGKDNYAEMKAEAKAQRERLGQVLASYIDSHGKRCLKYEPIWNTIEHKGIVWTKVDFCMNVLGGPEVTARYRMKTKEWFKPAVGGKALGMDVDQYRAYLNNMVEECLVIVGATAPTSTPDDGHEEYSGYEEDEVREQTH
jgi:hypothetical protein